MRLELVPYPSHHALQTALITKDVHAICMIQQQPLNMQPSCHIQTRIQRLYQIMQTMQTDLSPTLASLVHVTFMDLNLSTTNPIDAHSTGIEMSNPSEVES
jgi:putative multicomponent Na+:H+ antiporter subunit B